VLGLSLVARRSVLERIVDQQAGLTTVGRVSLAVERAADEFAREVLPDEEFRRTLHELIRRRCGVILRRILR